MIEVRRALNDAFKLNQSNSIDKMVIVIVTKDEQVLVSQSGHMSPIEGIGMCHVAINHITDGVKNE